MVKISEMQKCKRPSENFHMVLSLVSIECVSSDLPGQTYVSSESTTYCLPIQFISKTSSSAFLNKFPVRLLSILPSLLAYLEQSKMFVLTTRIQGFFSEFWVAAEIRYFFSIVTIFKLISQGYSCFQACQVCC